MVLATPVASTESMRSSALLITPNLSSLILIGEALIFLGGMGSRQCKPLANWSESLFIQLGSTTEEIDL